MKSVNQVKRQESLKKWLEIIKDQHASGLSALGSSSSPPRSRSSTTTANPSSASPAARKRISPSRSLPCRSPSSSSSKPSPRRRASRMSWCRSTSSSCRSTDRNENGKRLASRSLVQRGPTGSSAPPKTGSIAAEPSSAGCHPADETPVQVHKEKGRKNPAKSYMWVFSSGEFEQAHPIRLYEYQPGRSGRYVEEFLKGFNGILQTDGYTGYQKAACQAHALCWAHARRYFVEAIPPDLQKEYLLGSICKEAIERINKLLAIDKRLAGLTKEEREEQRL